MPETDLNSVPTAPRIRTKKRFPALRSIQFPADLPITAKKADIIDAIQRHQVVIIAGETGSGKTTQIPKMCLEAGLGQTGRIGCTQPRRVAAVSISRRIAEELNVPWGREVGCKIRFSNDSSPETVVKVMTDGILLAEIHHDPELRDYEALIIDEAHERSLNIDFLLGYLRQLLPRRPDLKVIVTSATIDTELFSIAFGHAPVIEVSGRLFPVEVRYAPMSPEALDAGEISYIEAAAEAATQALAESRHGDVLIFMPGERDIRETRDLLESRAGGAEVIPLFGRLSSADQQRVFIPGPRRRVIISTNIAETSLTLPRIRYVIDSGLARISRYNPRNRTKRLPIEPISQSSANQRKGRSGRVAEGVCIRLYSEEEFLARPLFTQPEVQRANLAEVILRMKALDLGNIEDFPFLTPPQPVSIQSGYQLLRELGALTPENDLTDLGWDLARLPVDPTIGRMLLAAARENALSELLIIAAGLSIPDPRERPADATAGADAAHRRSADPTSDFLSLLKLWRVFHEQAKNLKSQSQLRKFCKSQHLSFMRMREWQDLHVQLEELISEISGFRLNATPASYDAIHRAVLAGLVGQIAQKTGPNQYRATGQRSAMVFPGSTLFRSKEAKSAAQNTAAASAAPTKQPEWIVIGELVETSRLFARTVAGIQPDWVYELGSHLCSITHHEPFWSADSGRVLVRERIRFQGLELLERTVPFGTVNPREATEIFIRRALVPGEIKSPHRFLSHNRALRQKIETWQTRMRHHELNDIDAAFFRFYAARLENISSLPDLNRVVREQMARDPNFLCATESDLLAGTELSFDAAAFPDQIQIADQSVPVAYAYSPGEEQDGVTVRCSAHLAEALSAGDCDWIVPGFREEQIACLLRALPKSLRREFQPIDAKAAEMAKALGPQDGPFLTALSRFAAQRYGITIAETDWPVNELPNYLRPRFEVRGLDNRVIAAGRDWNEIKRILAKQTVDHREEEWQRAATAWERFGITQWNFADPPERIELASASGSSLAAFPGLQLEAGEVCLRLFPSSQQARQATRAGFLRLCELALSKELAWLQKDLRALDACKQLYVTLGSSDEFLETALASLKTHLFEIEPVWPLRKATFDAAVAQARERLPGLVQRFGPLIKSILELRQELLLCRQPFPTVRSELDELLPKAFLAKIRFQRLQHLPRYLRAMLVRAERARVNAPKDREKAAQIAPFQKKLAELQKRAAVAPELADQIEEFRWAIEEFKVSLFAQELGTVRPISAKRLEQQAAQISAK